LDGGHGRRGIRLLPSSGSRASLPYTILAKHSHKAIKIWNLLSGSCENHWTTGGQVLSLSPVSVQDGTILCGLRNGCVELWKAARNPVLVRTFRGHSDRVDSLATIDHQFFASASDDFSIKVWNFDSGDCTGMLAGHTRSVRSLGVWSSDELISASADGSLKLWSISETSCLATVKAHSSTVSGLCIQRGKVISCSWDGCVKFWTVI